MFPSGNSCTNFDWVHAVVNLLLEPGPYVTARSSSADETMLSSSTITRGSAPSRSAYRVILNGARSDTSNPPSRVRATGPPDV